MNLGPRAGLKMVEPAVGFGALKVLIDIPTTTADSEAPRFGGGRCRVSQIVRMRPGGSGRPIDYHPEFFKFALGLAPPVRTPNFPPRQAQLTAFATGDFSSDGLPLSGRDGGGDLRKRLGRGSLGS